MSHIQFSIAISTACACLPSLLFCLSGPNPHPPPPPPPTLHKQRTYGNCSIVCHIKVFVWICFHPDRLAQPGRTRQAPLKREQCKP